MKLPVIIKKVVKMKVAIVLGNRNNNDGTISKKCIERLELLLEADKYLKFDKVILSGGTGLFKAKSWKSEASLMAEYLKERDYDISKILLEDKSKTTRGNAKYSLEIVDNLKVKEVVIITSEEHLNRKWLNPQDIFEKQFIKYKDIKLHFYNKNL